MFAGLVSIYSTGLELIRTLDHCSRIISRYHCHGQQPSPIILATPHNPMHMYPTHRIGMPTLLTNSNKRTMKWLSCPRISQMCRGRSMKQPANPSATLGPSCVIRSMRVVHRECIYVMPVNRNESQPFTVSHNYNPGGQLGTPFRVVISLSMCRTIHISP